RTILLVVAIKLVVFVLFGFYNRWWRYFSTRDMWHAVLGLVVAWVLAGITIYFFSPVSGIRLPRLVWIMDGLLALALVTGVRLLARTDRKSTRLNSSHQ